MSEGILVAIVAAWPPTLAATLTFLAARASDRRASVERAAVTAESLDQLGTAVGRVEAAVERVETGLGDVRERVRPSGGIARTRRTTVMPRRSDQAEVTVVVPACPPPLNPAAAWTLLRILRAGAAKRQGVSPAPAGETENMHEGAREGLVQPRPCKPAEPAA